MHNDSCPRQLQSLSGFEVPQNKKKKNTSSGQACFRANSLNFFDSAPIALNISSTSSKNSVILAYFSNFKRFENINNLGKFRSYVSL